MDDHEGNSTNIEKFKADPEFVYSLVDKYVAVQLIKSVSFTGFLQSYDPVSNSVIILVPREESHCPVLIPGHAILEITEESTPLNVNRPQRKLKVEEETDLPQKKKRLMDWLLWNMLPSSESGENIVFRDIVHLLPPYSVKDICTTNTQVAMELKKVIERMPADFHLP